jgi:hypothetical protein
MEPANATAKPKSEAISAEVSAAFQALAEIFANVKGPGPYRRYLLECIDGELVFQQTESDAIVEAALAEVFGSDRRTVCRRIIRLRPDSESY